MIDYIIIAIILVIAVSIVCYLYRAKKSGTTCIGCPYAKQCGKTHDCSCGESKKK